MNYGVSTAFEIDKSRRFEGGKISFHFDVEDGNVKEAKIFGDFLGNKNILEIEDLLIGTRYEEEAFRTVLRGMDLEEYFHKITLEDIMQCIFY